MSAPPLRPGSAVAEAILRLMRHEPIVVLRPEDGVEPRDAAGQVLAWLLAHQPGYPSIYVLAERRSQAVATLAGLARGLRRAGRRCDDVDISLSIHLPELDDWLYVGCAWAEVDPLTVIGDPHLLIFDARTGLFPEHTAMTSGQLLVLTGSNNPEGTITEKMRESWVGWASNDWGELPLELILAGS